MPRIDGKPSKVAEKDRPKRPIVQLEWAPATLVALDPGGEHVGISFWKALEPPDDVQGGQGWYCSWSVEMTPDEAVTFLSREMLSGTIDILVYESFRLMADRAMQQVGSDMPTSQMIGVIKYLHKALAEAKSRWPAPPVEMFEQAPSIKKPTDSIRRSKGQDFQAKRDGVPGDHATDSELHAMYHILKTRNDRVLQTVHGGTNDADTPL